MSNYGSPSNNLVALALRVEADPQLCERLRACQTPADLLALAAELQLELPPRELRLWSRQLASPCWPWHNRGRDFRRAFFDQDPRTRL